MLAIFLQAAGGSAIPQMLLLGGMILVFWLFMIRPAS
jgi:preprotein translocase subunit YajC